MEQSQRDILWTLGERKKRTKTFEREKQEENICTRVCKGRKRKKCYILTRIEYIHTHEGTFKKHFPFFFVNNRERERGRGKGKGVGPANVKSPITQPPNPYSLYSVLKDAYSIVASAMATTVSAANLLSANLFKFKSQNIHTAITYVKIEIDNL